ncbi:hypothetical protein Tsubulata_040169 [Turnera subulata]|uniref:Uncharacterized protein n=1 Tax=Turnera subulata TaxID=218843 RepID=A0A9Q0GHG3_9ROSI|nr:hypothetical protein Tsubulata_040169 [Turnera subulata]
MGGCFSCSLFSESDIMSSPTAKVVSVNGDLREYPIPVSVSQVLESQNAASSSSSSSSSSSRFLCNSDMLSYDEYIPALDSDAQLQANQIYFVLPKSRLQQRLTAADMAALAVKASKAIQGGGGSSKKDAHRRKHARITPVLLVSQIPSDDLEKDGMTKSFEKPQPQQQQQLLQKQPAAGFSRSGSVKKFQRYTSRRAKLAVRSFKLRLSTIYEGAVL